MKSCAFYLELHNHASKSHILVKQEGLSLWPFLRCFWAQNTAYSGGCWAQSHGKKSCGSQEEVENSIKWQVHPFVCAVAS